MDRVRIGHASITLCFLAALGTASAMLPAPASSAVIDVELDPTSSASLIKAKRRVLTRIVDPRQR